MVLYSSGPNGFVWTHWFVSLLMAVCGLELLGCATSGVQGPATFKSEQFLTFGRVEVKDIGPNPRQFLSQLRFFDVVNTETKKRTRILVNKREGAFTASLEPGQYEVVRVQINEGPFMAESHVMRKFQINPDVVTYLGKWEFNVDTPRTQRMVRINISEDRSNWDAIIEDKPKLKTKTVVNSFPEPMAGETRLYAVSPNPKVKYFRRR